jgi:phosphoserine phosphatase
MTKEEIGELVAALPEGLDADEFIYKLVNWAVDREREACAKVCEDLIGTRAMARHCADAIRSRGGEK